MDLSRFGDDIGRFAQLVGAPCDARVVAQVLETFGAGFQAGAVELRTTTKPRPEVSFRYVDSRGSHDPYALGVAAKMLPSEGRAVDELVPELQQRFPIFGYGVDATAVAGVEKIWPFFDRPYPLEVAMELRSLPPSVARSEGWLRRCGLTHFSIIAADYRHASVNLYFVRHERAAEADLEALLGGIGVSAPSPNVLAYIARASMLGVTYSWRNEAVERVCFYVLAPSAQDVLEVEHPRWRALLAEAPSLAPDRGFVVGSSFGPSGAYTKLEVDYSGDSLSLLEKWIRRAARERHEK